MTILFEVAHFTERRLFFQHGEGTGDAAITFPSSVNLPLLKIISFNSLHPILHHSAHPHQSQSAPNHAAWVLNLDMKMRLLQPRREDLVHFRTNHILVVLFADLFSWRLRTLLFGCLKK